MPPERRAQFPERLAPDLAVRMDLGDPLDRAEVAKGVPTRTGPGRPGAPDRGTADRTVEWLGTDQVLPLADVVADPDLTRSGGVGLDAQVVEEVHGVPVAPG